MLVFTAGPGRLGIGVPNWSCGMLVEPFMALNEGGYAVGIVDAAHPRLIRIADVDAVGEDLKRELDRGRGTSREENQACDRDRPKEDTDSASPHARAPFQWSSTRRSCAESMPTR